MELDKQFHPARVDSRRRAQWAEGGSHRADPSSTKSPFAMVPLFRPKKGGAILVETALHDVVARVRRTRGEDVLWIPAAEDERSAETHRLLGASCDWSRPHTTDDPYLFRAACVAFVRLHTEGLLQRDRAVVPWCPRCGTARSDADLMRATVRGKLYGIRYPEAGKKGGGLVVATLRPETIFADCGVRVHPEDRRHSAWIGKEVQVPLFGRRIPVLADPSVGPARGAGAFRFTPGHDRDDHVAARRLGLEPLVALDDSGRMTAEAGDLAGLDRPKARKRILQKLEEQGLLVDVKEHEHDAWLCGSCGAVVEPRLSNQWFLRLGQLVGPAAEALENEHVTFFPSSEARACLEGVREARDWCVSRQVSRGLRIPAACCVACGVETVSEEFPSACEECGSAMRPGEDVLDPGFVAALRPFAALGWPEPTPELKRYYPTSFLVAERDTLRHAVARALVLGLRLAGGVPFRQVWVHGAVGGTGPDGGGQAAEEAGFLERYGTDAVRLGLEGACVPGCDVPLSEEDFAIGRAVVDELWSACRFVAGALQGKEMAPLPSKNDLALRERWILSRTHRLIASVDLALALHRFDRASNALCRFVRHEFCGGYLDLVKPALAREQDATAGAQAVLREVLDIQLRLLHPFLPFVTEDLWDAMHGERKEPLAAASWPVADDARIDPLAERDMDIIRDLVGRIRSLRAETRIDPSRRIDVRILALSRRNARLLDEQGSFVAALVRASSLCRVESLENDRVTARALVRGFEVEILLEGMLDFETEKARLRKELEQLETAAAARARKLANPSFLEQAPPEVVAKERAFHRDLLDRKKQLEKTLATLAAGGSS